MLKHFPYHKKKLSNCLIIILKLYLKPNPKQNMEQDSKYQQLNIPMALAQVKAGNISEKLLNTIRQITYSLYREKKITKKVYNNIMNSTKV